MVDFLQQYDENKIWKTLVTYDFSNKNHRNFTSLFHHVKQKLQLLTVADGILAFYEWKKAHRLYQFFNNIELFVPRESTQWIFTQNEQLWDVVAGDHVNQLFKKIKKVIKNPELQNFYKDMFGYQRNFAQKEKIVEKIEETKTLFEENSKNSKAYYYFPESKKYLLDNFSSVTLSKAKKVAQKKGWNGYCFILNYNNVYKLLTFISDRNTREKIYHKFNASMKKCEFQLENQKLLNKGLILKKQLAQCYGYKNYSDLVTSKYMVTMYQTEKLLEETEKQMQLMMAKPNSIMLDLFKKDGFNDNMKMWDFSYYQRKLRNMFIANTKIENHFQFDITFPKILKQMEKVFNVSIQCIDKVKGNEIYQVSDNLDKTKVAYWVIAPYSRKNEKNPYEIDFVRYAQLGKDFVPWIQFMYLQLNKNGKMNFLNIKNTIHELGHAFHSFFSNNENGKKNFGWDLVELPSQFLENLAYRYDFMAKITSSNYLSKKLFKREIQNYTFNDILYLYEKVIDFKTSFALNKNINPYSNKKIIKQMTLHRHLVGNYYNPFSETEHFSNSFETDYFANYVYFFSENIAKNLNLIYKEKDFRTVFKNFDLDKNKFKEFISSHMKVTDIDLVKQFDYSLFDKNYNVQ